jgi:maltose alpha-D-glucosyltransferase/alpha-amylase
VLAHRCDAEGASVVVLHNFADADVDASPVLPDLAGAQLTDVLDTRAEPVLVADDGRVTVTLPPYGCRWLRSGDGATARG